MLSRKINFAVLALCCFPAMSFAGPIEFSYATGNIKITPYSAPELALTLQGYMPPGGIYTFDPSTGTPVTLTAVSAVPQMLPPPSAIDLHPDGQGGGHTHWNNDGYFSVDVGLMDYASGDATTLTFYGRAHMYNNYSTTGGWTGTTYFWFDNYKEVTLGGNDYTVWSDNLFDTGPATVHVWVGPDAPVSTTPEPGTLALAALGFLPFGVRGLRRMW